MRNGGGMLMNALENLKNELEAELNSFQCWADDAEAISAAEHAAATFETIKLALKKKFGIDTAIGNASIALKRLRSFL